MRISAVTKELGVEYDGIDINFTGIQYDSRKVTSGDIFVCLKGAMSDGHRFAKMAVDLGAVGLLVESYVDDISSDVPQIAVADTRVALAKISELYYNYPGEKLKIIGVTGTNGKTTTTHLIRNVLMAAGHKTGLIGTNHNIVGGKTYASTHTTPESLEISALLDMMVQAGDEYVVMEVSSHGLSQHRVDGIHFKHGVFTNLTQDHLDYHKSFSDYLAAKLILFKGLKNIGDQVSYGVVNIDDNYGTDFVESLSTGVITYGLSDKAMVYARDVKLSMKNTKFNIVYDGKEYSATIPYLGYFNVYNALAAVGVLIAEGLSMEFIIESIAHAEQVHGRFQALDGVDDFAVIIDYAHSPDGLQNILKTAREIKSGRLILVFGCGGDRDKTKRPIMGKLAGQLSDYSIITSDNPRTEDPLLIIRMVEDGIKFTGGEYQVIANRSLAIKKAIKMANSGDMVIIAGKGHEDYQIIGTEKHHFDDFEEATKALAERK